MTGSGTGYVDSSTGQPLTESQFNVDPFAPVGPSAMDIPIALPQVPNVWPGGGPTI